MGCTASIAAPLQLKRPIGEEILCVAAVPDTASVMRKQKGRHRHGQVLVRLVLAVAAEPGRPVSAAMQVTRGTQQSPSSRSVTLEFEGSRVEWTAGELVQNFHG